jgi:hypothetical protein
MLGWGIIHAIFYLLDIYMERWPRTTMRSLGASVNQVSCPGFRARNPKSCNNVRVIYDATVDSCHYMYLNTPTHRHPHTQSHRRTRN